MKYYNLFWRGQVSTWSVLSKPKPWELLFIERIHFWSYSLSDFFFFFCIEIIFTKFFHFLFLKKKKLHLSRLVCFLTWNFDFNLFLFFNPLNVNGSVSNLTDLLVMTKTSICVEKRFRSNEKQLSPWTKLKFGEIQLHTTHIGNPNLLYWCFPVP